MADKKVGRSGRERPITPTQKLTAALSDPGTMNMAEPTHDKGKSALVDKFRAREERWRTEQSFRAREAAREADSGPEEVVEAGESAESEDPGGGGEA
jgi:hypothetical protein